jgi:molybdopterin molybdotransferase
MMPAFTPREAIPRALADAHGLALADDVIAGGDLPAHDDSAMDGYAVRHAEAAQGARLPIAGASTAGGSAPPPLAPGTAMRIFTGALLPEGADAVVMQENVGRDDATITIHRAPDLGMHVRRRGSDVARGSRVLERGTPLGPGELGLLAALDCAVVRVHQRPRVAIVCTGDELREVGATATPGTIVNSNAIALAAQVREAGGEPWVLPPARDDVDAIVARFEEALTADCVLGVGGVSVGDRDHVRAAFDRLGVAARFWKVAIKPGKPLFFGTREGVPIAGLPGNPVSAMVTFEVFVKPGIRRMLGEARPYPVPLDAVLAAPYRHAAGRTEFARARLYRQDGRVVAHLHPRQGSGALISMAAIDALVVLDAERELFAAGDTVPALELRGGRSSDVPPFA